MLLKSTILIFSCGTGQTPALAESPQRVTRFENENELSKPGWSLARTSGPALHPLADISRLLLIGAHHYGRVVSKVNQQQGSDRKYKSATPLFSAHECYLAVI
jgi:hypothetical protein